MLRSLLLAASQNRWLLERAPRYGFVRRTAARFMPGERVEDALAAAHRLAASNVGAIFTNLGENVSDPAEAEAEVATYLDILKRMADAGLQPAVSVKLTHLGLDLDPDFCLRNLLRIVLAAGTGTVWIDMESSRYVARTLEVFCRARAESTHVGVCVQAYLYRTAEDVETLLALGAAIRLVKGAYQEPREIAMRSKADVDRNFFALAQRLLSHEARSAGVCPALGTHDLVLIRRIIDWAEGQRIPKDSFEFQMLYGIQREEQARLAQAGFRSNVLICYGTSWYSWFMRRMAERPANVWFALRNIVAG